MLIMAALIGLLAGWFFCWASELGAPQTTQHAPVAQGSTGAVGILAARRLFGRRNAWLWPHVGVVLASTAIFGYVWERSGLSWESLRLAGCYGFLVVTSLIDFKFRRVPNRLVYPAIVIALLYQGFASPGALAPAVVGGGMAFAIFYLTAWLRPGELGGGDIKLATLIGISFGFPRVVWALLVGAGLGAAVAVTLIFILRRSAKSRIPYAPFLCLGAWVALVYYPWPRLWH
jgi:prepilin signal peptidase PulO-like enzyme (type II secretory pathway)